MSLDLFVPITKVDESQRLVFGVVAEEVVDHSNEVFDYASSKPHFEKWSEETFQKSGGKSKGNLRTMHGKVAAGKLTDIGFNDEERRISCVAKVVDDGEWKKVLEGVYTGFSMGGRYGNRWLDKSDGKSTRYEAIPNEVSLVDKPCIPSATFQLIKADGKSEDRMFKGFDESKVNRHSKGSSQGGQFAPKGEGSSDSGSAEDRFYEYAQAQGVTVGDMDEGVFDQLDYNLLDGALNQRDMLSKNPNIPDFETIVGGELKSDGTAVGLTTFVNNSSGSEYFRVDVSRGTGGSYTVDNIEGNEGIQTAILYEFGGMKGVRKADMVYTNEELTARATQLSKAAGGDGSNWASYVDAAREDLEKSSLSPKKDPQGHNKDDPDEGATEADSDEGETEADPDAPENQPEGRPAPEKVEKFEVHQVWVARDGKTFLKKAEALEHDAGVAKTNSPLLKGIRELRDSLKGRSSPLDELAKSLGDRDETLRLALEKVAALHVTAPDDEVVASVVEAMEKLASERSVPAPLDKAEGSEGEDALRKSLGEMGEEIAALKKSLEVKEAEQAEATSLLKSLADEIAAIKKLPMPSVPRGNVVVDKGDDVAKRDGPPAPDLSKLAPDELAKMAISLAQQNGHRYA